MALEFLISKSFLKRFWILLSKPSVNNREDAQPMYKLYKQPKQYSISVSTIALFSVLLNSGLVLGETPKTLPAYKNSYEALMALNQKIQTVKQQQQVEELANSLAGMTANANTPSPDKQTVNANPLPESTSANPSARTPKLLPFLASEESSPEDQEGSNAPEYLPLGNQVDLSKGPIYSMGPDFAGQPILPDLPKEAKAPPPTPQKTLRTEAFKQLLENQSPLTPDQILELRRQHDQIQKATMTPTTAPPRPVSSTIEIDLSPGFAPPLIRLAAGYVSSIVFVDETGKPWPLSDYSLGNSKDFNIQWDKKTHTLFMQSNTPYATGNMAIRLAKLSTPISISLVAGQKEVDYRLDLQIKARGPNAEAPISNSLPQSTPRYLINALDGIPPPKSQELAVHGGQGRAWLFDNKLIFRSNLTVLSPAWTHSVSSPDGTHVYELAQTSLILASQQGKPIKINIKGI